MLKIGIDIRNIGKKRTGDETVFFNITKHLANIDTNNTYYLLTDICDEGQLKEISLRLGLKDATNFHIVSLPTKDKFTWNFWSLPRYLKKNQLDVYLTQYITPFFVSKRTKIVTIIHDISFNFYPRLLRPIDLFFFKTLIPISLKRANAIVGVSQFTYNEIKEYYNVPGYKMHWIHNAVAENILNTDITTDKTEAIRKKYQLPADYILYVGTMQPRKDLPTLIEAFNIIKGRSHFPELKLVLAGGKGHNYDKKIDSTLARLSLRDDVHFPGYVDEKDKAAILQQAKVFCLPSLYEGFGIPILEAMARGIPVVASDIPPHNEIAENSARYFSPQNPEDLAAVLEQVLLDSSERTKMIVQGKTQVEKFSWEKTAAKLLTIFASVSEQIDK